MPAYTRVSPWKALSECYCYVSPLADAPVSFVPEAPSALSRAGESGTVRLTAVTPSTAYCVKRRHAEIRVLRAVAGVAGGLFTWVVVATVGNLLLRIVWPSYAEVEVAMNFTPAMLVMRLLLGALSSLCAGFLAARITKRSRGPVHILACLLVVAFIPVHYELWERFPVWYHLVFLVSLVAATIFGAMCYSYYARRKGKPLAD